LSTAIMPCEFVAFAIVFSLSADSKA
jgi:hypothetical protein